MKRKKILQKLAEFFDMDVRARSQSKDEINELLSRLKQKELELKKKLERETDPSKQRVLEQKIDLVHRQRKKGLNMMIELRSED